MVSSDPTVDPAFRSWVDSANDGATDFPIQNLPFGVFRRRGTRQAPRVGVAIGDRVLDIVACRAKGWFDGHEAAAAAAACRASSLNGLMALGPAAQRALRHRVFELLRHDGDLGKTARAHANEILAGQADVEMLNPARVGNFTDFFASVYHAANVGSLFRPDQPLQPNYKHVPIAYHGRASSVSVSGSPCRRPLGQRRPAGAENPAFGPSDRLDFELEVGVFVSAGNPLGRPIPLSEAPAHVFGLCLLNDWSARDIQAWEYQPLGPFLAKSFMTTVSPWVVTLDALAPFRVPALVRPDGDPDPLPYLSNATDQASGSFDIALEVLISSAAMRAAGSEPKLLTRSNLRHLYWTIFQMLAHHTSNGCNIEPGDLLGTGTASGPTDDSRGCLLELTQGGKTEIELPGGETRTWLEDGDEVVLRAHCAADGAVRIGLGECRGIIAAAPVLPT